MLYSSNVIPFIHTIKSEFIEDEMSFMTKQLKRVKESKPYKGFSILQNIPFTKETLIKTEILIEGGAEVTITSPSFMDPDPVLVDNFKQSGGIFIEQKKLKDSIFDFHLDCAAELLSFQPPRIGTVEITGTGTNKYRDANATYPIISIDQSVIKNLEGVLGTGEAFLRAFKKITLQDVRNKQFMIFTNHPGAEMKPWALGSNGWGTGYLDQYNTIAAFVAEFVFTFIFLMVILGSTSTKNINGGFAGLAIGFSLVLIHIVGIKITGVSVNPARSIGPAIFAGGEALSQLWLFILAPVLGGVFAAFTYNLLIEKPEAAK